MSNKDVASFVELEGKEEQVVEAITHKNLKDVVNAVLFDNSRMVIVKATSTDKPEWLWDKELDANDYTGTSEKMEYLTDKVGLTRADVILPITSKTIEKVSEEIGSKAVTKVEKYLYDLVLEENNNRNENQA